jgi:hypothetical protein
MLQVGTTGTKEEEEEETKEDYNTAKADTP